MSESEILPDCMMPDGAEPCEGYIQLLAKYTTLAQQTEAITKEFRGFVDENERLYKALKPFATVGLIIEKMRKTGTFDRAGDEPFTSGAAWSEHGERKTLTWDDFHDARAALEAYKAGRSS